MMDFKIIALSGVGRAGKDSFYRFASEFLEEKGISSGRWAVADELKRDLDPFIKDKFGFSCFTEIPEEKELVRPLMVEYGKIWRKKSKGKHWLGKIKDTLLAEEGPQVRFITDLRFNYFDGDEGSFVKENGGKIVHIQKYEPGNNFHILAAANEEEAKNDPLIRGVADVKFRWHHFTDCENGQKLAKIAVSDILEKHPELWT